VTFLDLFRSTGPIAVIVGGCYGAGVWIDSLVRPQARDAFGHYLAQGKFRDDLQSFPTGTFEAFERIFGKRHWGIKSISWSFVFTYSSILLIALLIGVHAKEWRTSFLDLFPSSNEDDYRLTPTLVRILETILVSVFFLDYFNLYKSRLILGWLTKSGSQHLGLSLLLVLCDLIATFYLLCIYLAVVTLIQVYLTESFDLSSIPLIRLLLEPAAGDGLILVRLVTGAAPPNDMSAWVVIVLLSGLLPSAWTLLCVSGIAFTRLIARSERLFRALKHLLPIEEKPFMSLGAVTGAIVCLGYLAVIGALAWIR